MSKKYVVCAASYTSLYMYDFEVEADSEAEAIEKVLSGNYIEKRDAGEACFKEEQFIEEMISVSCIS